MGRRRRTSNCWCDGRGFRDKGHRWRVLDRQCQDRGPSVLKCLQCGCIWKSRCRYVDRLSDHQERSRSGMTDQDTLNRLLDGSIIVDIHKCVVLSTRSRHRKRLKVYRRTGGVRSNVEYRFVIIGSNGRLKKIALHRLVWMAANLELIPDGVDIHHKTHDRHLPDAIDNLEALPSEINRATNARKVDDSEFSVPF